MNINATAFESYLQCPYKSYLSRLKKAGSAHEYELISAELQKEYRSQAIDAPMAKRRISSVHSVPTISLDDLRKGHDLIVDCFMESKGLEARLDAIRRVDGLSCLGDYLYIPAMFDRSATVRKHQKLSLAFRARILASLQATQPTFGEIVYGPSATVSKVKLDTYQEELSRYIEQLNQSCNQAEPPKLRLNRHCDTCPFRENCRLEACERDDLSLLRAITEPEIHKLNRRGIFTVYQLSHTFRSRRQMFGPGERRMRHNHALKAVALRNSTTYVLAPYQIPSSQVQVFLDVEGSETPRFVYLIGVHIRDRDNTSFHSYWANSKDDEIAMFERFINEMRPYATGDSVFFHYGNYDFRFLARMQSLAKNKRLTTQMIERSFDVLPLLNGHVYLPTYSNGLKEIGKFLGYQWSDKDASGLLSVVWRHKWEQSKDEELKTRLIEYNRDDCLALQRVVQFLRSVNQDDVSSGVVHYTFDGLTVENAASLKTYGGRLSWRTAKLVEDDFVAVNRCSYFDYQRQKVFARTNKTIRRATEKTKNRRKRKQYRVNRRVDIAVRKCSYCRSRKITPVLRTPKTKLAFDLRITSTGIRRQVIECRAVRYRCDSCLRTFLPERFKHRDRHFHSLRSWSIHQNIEYRTSLNQIGSMLQKYFDLPVDGVHVFRFKEQMARYYRATYRRIRDSLLRSSVLHVDETSVKLKSHSAYVWVFASLEHVYYMYRTTREGSFLASFLDGFSGVLVSDFYGAYDSLKCQQQKCLVHLMRDINNEMLRHPYDLELRHFAQEFGAILRRIVETIDEHGLRRKYLARHKRDVRQFLEKVIGSIFSSDTAEQLRKRIVRYQDRLFAFLNHDGVPWNNNNAENAVKHFAYYRDKSGSVGTPKTLQNHLLLLSVCQTCKYKGIDFLDFLLSRVKDVEKYDPTWRRQARSPTVDVYPAGFTRTYSQRKVH